MREAAGREIARRAGLSRSTIRSYLKAGAVEPKCATPQRPSKLNPFAEKLAGWLRTEAAKSRKQRRTAKQLQNDLVSLGYTGSYNRVASLLANGASIGNVSSRPRGVVRSFP